MLRVIKLLLFLNILFIIIILPCCGNPSISLLMICSDDCNELNAVQLKIYQLRSSEKFDLADRESLLRNIEETLGKDLIPRLTIEKIMIPGEVYKIDNIEISEETKYIGILGDFFSPAKNGWSLLIDATKAEDNKIIVGRNSLSLSK